MTASEQAKAAGLKSLAQAAEISGQSVRTLNNWHKAKPKLFAIVLAGCVSELQNNNRLHRQAEIE